MQSGIVGIADQRDVQQVIDTASPEQRAHLQTMANRFLSVQTRDSAKRRLTRKDRRARRIAIEILVSLESAARGGAPQPSKEGLVRTGCRCE